MRRRRDPELRRPRRPAKKNNLDRVAACGFAVLPAKPQAAEIPRTAVMADLRTPTRSSSIVEESRKLTDLHAVLEISRQLGAGLDLGNLLQIIEQATLKVLDCERISIFLHDPQSDELWSRLSTGQQSLRIPSSLGIA